MKVQRKSYYKNFDNFVCIYNKFILHLDMIPLKIFLRGLARSK